jgi:three-Cys-motif partner protein
VLLGPHPPATVVPPIRRGFAVSPEDEDDKQFYHAQSPASKAKIAIVTKYFAAWAKILGPYSVRMAYQDLYCGPGRYEKTGEASTPVLIVEQVISDPKLRDKVETYFNDEDPKHTAALKRNLEALPDYETLKFKPVITTMTVDRGFEEQLRHISRVPTFSFVDPFGYKGITLRLLQRILEGFGCDLVLFFRYNRIRAAITNNNVEHHIVALFGEKRFEELKRKLAGKTTAEREAIILDTFGQALKEMGFKYVHPFTFKQVDRNRTSHHLIFVSKNAKAYEVMKDITGKESSSHDEGVPSFGYAPPVSAEVTPLLFEFARPLEQLGTILMDEYAEQTVSFEDLFEEHNVGRRYLRKNYKEVLKQMEAEGSIKTERASGKPKRKKNTFPDDLIVTFPPKEKK